MLFSYENIKENPASFALPLCVLHDWTAFVSGAGIFFMDSLKEEIRVVPEYPDYSVSNTGKVFSNKNGVCTELKLGKSKYLNVSLYHNGKSKTITVHVLMAIVFLGHKPNGTTEIVVDHIDKNKLNNHLSNLRLISNRENISRTIRGSSKYTGVSFDTHKQKWKASIRINNKTKHIGNFDNEKDASIAYQKVLNDINNGIPFNRDNHSYVDRVEGCIFKQKRCNSFMVNYKKKYLGSFKTEKEAKECLERHIKNEKR